MLYILLVFKLIQRKPFQQQAALVNTSLPPYTHVRPHMPACLKSPGLACAGR